MQPTSSLAINNIVSLLLIPILTLASYGLGARALRLLKLDRRSWLEWTVFSTTLGLGILSYATLALGLLGLLYQPVAYGLVLLALLIGGGELLAAARRLPHPAHLLHSLRSRWRATSRAKRLAFGALACVFLIHVAMNIFVALAPPVFADSLGYHLAAPKVYIQDHRMTYIPILTWTFPFTPQMLYMLGMLLWSDRVATLLSVLMGTLAGLGILAFGRRHLRLGLPATLFACVLFYTTPLMISNITAPMEDAGLALFTLLAAYAVVNWLDTGKRGWLVLAGVMAGWAMGSKYHGLLLPPCLAAFLLLWSAKRHRFTRALAAPALFAVVSLLVASPWFLRNWIATGTPIWTRFPLAQILAGALERSSLTQDPLGLLLGPWTYTVDQFPETRALLSPLYLAFLPGLLLLWPRDRMLRDVATLLLAYPALFYVGWYVTNRNIDYFSAVLALPALLTAYVIQRLAATGKWWQPVIALSIAANQLFSLAGGALYTSQAVPVVLGLQSEEQFLLEMSPFQEVWQYVNRNLPPESNLFVFPRHTYYLERDYFRAPFTFQDLVDYPVLDSPEQLLARLRQLGFTHVVWDEWHGRESDLYLETVTGEEMQVEQQLQALEASGDLIAIFHDTVRPLRSRMLGRGEDLEVLIYAIRQ